MTGAASTDGNGDALPPSRRLLMVMSKSFIVHAHVCVDYIAFMLYAGAAVTLCSLFTNDAAVRKGVVADVVNRDSTEVTSKREVSLSKRLIVREKPMCARALLSLSFLHVASL